MENVKLPPVEEISYSVSENLPTWNSVCGPHTRTPVFTWVDTLWSCLEGIQLLSVDQICNLGVIFDSALFFYLFVFMYINFVSFSSLKSLLISVYITDKYFRLLLSLSLLMTGFFFPLPDLTCQKGPLKYYSCTYLHGLFLCLLFVLASLAYLHRFSCLCKPCSSLRSAVWQFFWQLRWPKTVSAPSHSLLSLWYAQ